MDNLSLVVCHDVPQEMREMFVHREDVIWMADTFIMYLRRFRKMDVKIVRGVL